MDGEGMEWREDRWRDKTKKVKVKLQQKAEEHEDSPKKAVRAVTITSVSRMRGRGRIVFDELAGREEVRGVPLIIRARRSPRRWSNGRPREVKRLNGKSRWWRSPWSSEISRRPRRNRSSTPDGTVSHRPTRSLHNFIVVSREGGGPKYLRAG